MLFDVKSDKCKQSQIGHYTYVYVYFWVFIPCPDPGKSKTLRKVHIRVPDTQENFFLLFASFHCQPFHPLPVTQLQLQQPADWSFVFRGCQWWSFFDGPTIFFPRQGRQSDEILKFKCHSCLKITNIYSKGHTFYQFYIHTNISLDVPEQDLFLQDPQKPETAPKNKTNEPLIIIHIIVHPNRQNLHQHEAQFPSSIPRRPSIYLFAT